MKKIYILLILILVLFASCQSGSEEKSLISTSHIDLMNFGNRAYLIVAIEDKLSLIDLVSYEKVYGYKTESDITAIYCHKNSLYLGTKNGALYRDSFSLKSKKTQRINSKKIGKFKSAIVVIRLVDNSPMLYLSNNDFLYLNPQDKVIKKKTIRAKSLKVNRVGIGFLNSENSLYFINHDSKKKSFVLKNVLGYAFASNHLFFSEPNGNVYSIHLDGKRKTKIKDFNTPNNTPIYALALSRDGQYLLVATKQKQGGSVFMSYDLFSGRIFYEPIKGQVLDLISYNDNKYNAILTKKNVQIRGFQGDRKGLIKEIELNSL